MVNNAFEPFVRNAWYLGAWNDELDKLPLSRTIMDEPIVFFRDSNGKAAALEDRCCHRGAPLSHGRVVETGLECGYHGLIFDGRGICVDVPGNEKIPPNALVRSYPVIERQEFIWIWMGDPTLANESLIIDFPFHGQTDKWPHRKDMFPIKANYMMMMDNLMDLSHLGYVHRKTIGGNPDAHVAAEMEVTPTDTGVRFVRWMLDAPSPPSYRKAAHLEGNVDRWWDLEYVVPCSVLQWTGAIGAGKGAQENQDQAGFHTRVFHSATPETKSTFHYFWSISNGFRTDDPEATEELYKEIYPTFLEDKEIMEVQQERLELNPSREFVVIPADKALTYARRAISCLIEKEQTGLKSAAE